MIKSTSLAPLAGFVFVLAACAGTAAPESGQMPPETATPNAPAVRAGEPVADVSGTWAFELAKSDVAAPAREKCAVASADPATQASCWSSAVAEAKLEKVRFTKTDETGHATWTSFAVDGDAETMFVAAPVVLSHEGAAHVVAKIAGTPTGPHASRLAQAKVDAMRIEIVDARTIALVDPKKGRLVYSKE